MKDIKLIKPLCFIDLETTGLVIGRDRVIQIALLKWMPDHSTRLKSWYIRPDIPVSEESIKIHGITPEKLNNAPSFRQVGNEIASFIGHSDLAGYNSNRFDIPMLMEEFYRSGIEFSLEGRNIFDVQYIYHLMEPRTLAAAYSYYCNKKLEHAHHAESDVQATYEIFLAQLEKYHDLEITENGKNIRPVSKDIHKMGSFFKSMNKQLDLAGRILLDDQGNPCFSFGKYKGQKVSEVFGKDPSYYHWIMNGDFSYDTKNVVTRLYLDFKNQRKN